MRALVGRIATGFVYSQEYGARNRDNWEYVEDLYNGILRRGADPSGFLFWVNLLNSGTQSRDWVLGYFVISPEFQMRVQQVIDAGCIR